MTDSEMETVWRCRRWMQVALDELSTCSAQHTVSLAEGEKLLEQMDALINRGLRGINTPEGLAQDLRQRLYEIEGAMAVVGKTMLSLDGIVRAAKAIEGRGEKRQ